MTYSFITSSDAEASSSSLLLSERDGLNRRRFAFRSVISSSLLSCFLVFFSCCLLFSSSIWAIVCADLLNMSRPSCMGWEVGAAFDHAGRLRKRVFFTGGLASVNGDASSMGERDCRWRLRVQYLVREEGCRSEFSAVHPWTFSRVHVGHATLAIARNVAPEGQIISSLPWRMALRQPKIHQASLARSSVLPSQ